MKEHPTYLVSQGSAPARRGWVKEHPRHLVSQTDAFLSLVFAQSLRPQMEHSTKTYDAATLRHLSSLCWECVAQWHRVIRLAFVTAFFSSSRRYLLYSPHSHRTVATHLPDKERGSNHTPRRGCQGHLPPGGPALSTARCYLPYLGSSVTIKGTGAQRVNATFICLLTYLLTYTLVFLSFKVMKTLSPSLL